MSRTWGVLLELFILGAGLLLALLLWLRSEVLSEEITSWTEDEKSDCALVLTGGPSRIREGFALLARNQVRYLIVSGVNPSTELRDLMTPWDLFLGLPRDRIILEKRSTTTYGNARQTLPLVEGLGCQRVALVSSALHMFRAYRTFRSAYPDSIVLVRHAVPPAAAGASWGDYALEMTKTVFYSFWAF